MIKMIKCKTTNKIIIFIVLFCMLSISSCSGSSKNTNTSQPEKQNNSETPKTQTGANQPVQQTTTGETQVKVTPPDGWEPVEGSTALHQYMNNGSSFIVTADFMPSSAKTPDAYMDFVKEQFTKVFDDVKYGDIENLTIAGVEGRKLIFTCKVAGFEMKYNVYYAFNNSKAYTFTCGGLSNQFDTLGGDYEKFINSVKFE